MSASLEYSELLASAPGWFIFEIHARFFQKWPAADQSYIDDLRAQVDSLMTSWTPKSHSDIVAQLRIKLEAALGWKTRMQQKYIEMGDECIEMLCWLMVEGRLLVLLTDVGQLDLNCSIVVKDTGERVATLTMWEQTAPQGTAPILVYESSIPDSIWSRRSLCWMWLTTDEATRRATQVIDALPAHAFLLRGDAVTFELHSHFIDDAVDIARERAM